MGFLKKILGPVAEAVAPVFAEHVVRAILPWTKTTSAVTPEDIAEGRATLGEAVSATTPRSILRRALAEYVSAKDASERFFVLAEQYGDPSLTGYLTTAWNAREAREMFPPGSSGWNSNNATFLKYLDLYAEDLREWLSRP